jgi:hypothetical protein
MHHRHLGHRRRLQCPQDLLYVPSVLPQAWPHEHEYSNPAVLAAELRAFAQAAGIPSNMLPTARALTQANRNDLLQVRSHAAGPLRLPVPELHVALLPSRQMTIRWAD